MIITEQNRNNNFDETRAFSAPVNGETRPVRPNPNTADPSRAVRNPSNIQNRPTQPQRPQNVDGARPRSTAPQSMPQKSPNQRPVVPLDRVADGRTVNHTKPDAQNHAPRPVQRPVQMQSQQRNPAHPLNSQSPKNEQAKNHHPINQPLNPQPKSTVNPSAAQIRRRWA